MSSLSALALVVFLSKRMKPRQGQRKKMTTLGWSAICVQGLTLTMGTGAIFATYREAVWAPVIEETEFWLCHARVRSQS